MTVPAEVSVREHSARYLVVAGLSALLSNVLLIGGDRAGLGTTGAVLVSWFITGSAAYWLHALITFREPLKAKTWLRYIAGTAAGIPAGWLMLQVLITLLGWPMLYAAPLVTVIMFGYHYINARLAITRTVLGFNRAA